MQSSDDADAREVQRNHAVFSCPDCGHEVDVTSAESLADVEVLCRCNRPFPSMEHERGNLGGGSRASEWRSRAVENVETWGNQHPATLLLAMAEEMGEIAEELLARTSVGNIGSSEARRGRRLLSQLAGHGIRVRSYLEDTFDDPAGQPETQQAIDGRDIATRINGTDEVQRETDDLAPLVWQLSWALDGEHDD